MNHSANVRKHRHQTATSALPIAEEIEAGRAVAPFQQQLKNLASDHAQPVRAAIIAANSDDLHALLSEIIGHDYNVCKVVVPSRLGFSEVLLQERGFLLDTGAGPQEFDDSGTFLTALQEAHALHQDDDDQGLEPLRVKLKGPTHLNGLCLLVPHSLEALQSKPALLSTLADQADWVFLVGNQDTEFTPEQSATIQLLLDNVTGLQNVMHPGLGTKTSPVEWWKDWKVTLSLGLVEVGTDLLRSRLSLLTAPDSELRQYLVESRRQRELEMALGLMNEETQQLTLQLDTRLTLSKEGLVGAGATGDLRKTAEAIRTQLSDELESINQAIERDTKAALAPEGAINQRLRECANLIDSDDIEQTQNETLIKLGVAAETNQRLSQVILDIAHERFRNDYEELREGFACSLKDAEKALESATGVRHPLPMEMPDDTTLWENISNLSRPEIRYRGEMPRPTLMSRLSAARQGIMSLMIAGTILGGAATLTGEGGGQNIRTTLYALMLPLLVIGFLWTYVSFRKKERQLLEKEVEKLQDGVFSELRRVLQELYREQQSLINKSLQKNLRSSQQLIERTLDQLDKQRQRDADDTRRRQGEQQRSIEQRITRLREVTRQLDTLQNQLPVADKLQIQWLGDWIKRFNEGKI